jgi:hypothetical protein
MVITRRAWAKHGDLLSWIATTYPGLSREEFEAAYALLADPNLDVEAAGLVEELLRGCAAARLSVENEQ